MKHLLILITGALLFFSSATLNAAVTAVPSAVKAPYNQPSSVPVQYRFTEPATCVQAVSAEIEVLGRDHVDLMTIPSLLTVPLASGSASVSDRFRITPAILNLARADRSSQLIFRRVFNVTCGAVSFDETVDIPVTITTQAAGDFALNRIDLYFDGNTPHASVAMHDRLNAFARVSFNGSGLLRGYWQVDGHAYAPISVSLAGRESIVLKFSEQQFLPTFNPGTHRVEFVVTSPTPAFETPYALYLVSHTPESPLIPVTLKTPGEQEAVFRETALYRWEPAAKAVTYRIDFFAAGSTEALFSAYTLEGDYALPAYAGGSFFEPGREYSWQVTGYNSEGNAVAKSAARTFRLIGK